MVSIGFSRKLLLKTWLGSILTLRTLHEIAALFKLLCLVVMHPFWLRCDLKKNLKTFKAIVKKSVPSGAPSQSILMECSRFVDPLCYVMFRLIYGFDQLNSLHLPKGGISLFSIDSCYGHFNIALRYQCWHSVEYFIKSNWINTKLNFTAWWIFITLLSPSYFFVYSILTHLKLVGRPHFIC